MPSRLQLAAQRLWFDSEPLCTRHWSRPVENGCAPSVVTADSVAMRVWPMRVRAGHVGELEAAGDRVGAADLLVDLHARAGADHLGAVAEAGDEVARLLLGLFRHREDGMRVVAHDRHGSPERIGKLPRQRFEIIGRGPGAHRELDVRVIAAAVDGEAGAVGPPLAHGREHGGHHFAEARFERLVLEE